MRLVIGRSTSTGSILHYRAGAPHWRFWFLEDYRARVMKQYFMVFANYHFLDSVAS